MGLLDLFGGGSGASDPGGLYGDVLSPDQKQALAYRGLLGFLGGMQKSGALDYVMPFQGMRWGSGAAGLAGGAAGMGEAQDTAAKNAMQAKLLGLQGQQLQGNLAMQQAEMGILPKILGQGGAGQGSASASGAPDGMLSLPTAGQSTPAGTVKQAESNGDYNVGYGGADLSNAPKDENGFPIWEGKQGPQGISHAAGAYQFQPATWAQYAKPLGVKDFSPASQDAVFRAAYLDQGLKPWAANPQVAANSGSAPQGVPAQPQGLLANPASNAAAAPPGALFDTLASGAPAAPASGGMVPGGGINPQAAQALAFMRSSRGAPVPDFINKAAGLPLVGPTAAAEAMGKLPFTQDTVRPGSIHTMGGKPDFAAPVQVDKVDPATGRSYKTWEFPPLPGAQANAGPAGMPGAAQPGEVTKLGPQEETERKGIGETLSGEYKDAVASYKHAQGALPTLTTIENAMQNFRTGPFAGDRLKLGQAWQDFAGSIGLAPDSNLAKWISSGEIINKEGNVLGFELARTLGSREAQNIVQQAIASNPGLYNSPQGNEKLIGLIKQGLQRDVDRRNFYDSWLDPKSGHGTLAGAATAFDKAKPADFYVSQILPMHPKSPDDLKKLAPGTRYTRPGNDSMVYTIPGQ